jgi:hypothetical protein
MIIPLELMLSSVPHMAKASSTMAETPPPSNTRTNGNFLVEFAQPSEPFDAIRRDLPLGIGKPPLLAGKQLQSVVDKYRTMERKGFRVTKDIGCLIPDEQYDTYQPGSTFKGHQRTFAFFARWVPKHGTSATRNEFGWPTDLQISHLCHRRSCCRVDHLVAEEQWRNLKRTYCGLHGECDCGQPVKCLRRYQMQDQAETPEFCGTKEQAVNALAGAPPFVIHGSSRCSGGHNKSHLRKVNNEKRKRKQDAHAHKTARKQARLQTQSDEDE